VEKVKWTSLLGKVVNKMAYITAIIEFCKPYAIKLAEKLIPVLIENIILNKRKKESKMAEETTTSVVETLKDTVTAVGQTVAVVAEATAEQQVKAKMNEELEEFVTKKKAEIVTTKNSYVKVRDQLYITLVTASEAELDAQVSVLGVKALAQLEKLIAKM